MEVVNPVCCGLDVHKASVVACLRRDRGGGVVEKATRTFSTTMAGLRELSQWLNEAECPVAAMESTGVYWKPVYHVLSRSVQLVVGNPRDMRRRPGRKTDKTDAEWISELMAHGLIPPSFVPPPEIAALRDLTRTRTALLESRSQAKNRVHKTLEDTNLKLGSVVSDLFGKSGRAMLDALIRGERDPKALAKLAKGRLRRKLGELELALEGQFTPHHGAIIQLALEQIDLLTAQLETLDQQIEEGAKQFGPQLAQLDSIPGIDKTAALAILAEIGVDMERFGSDKRLAAWAGMAPGNHESAGKRQPAVRPKGNKWLRRMLNQAAWAAHRTDTFVGRTFRSLQARIGGKKAAVAIGHKILVIAFHLLKDGTFYDEDHFRKTNPHLEARWKNNALRTLDRLGWKVSLELKPA